ncbi:MULTISPECIES: hypothetical protein [unclassified Olleya]|jgi:hypothetical protein|uniref:hypothetical protein n=1 Tax=unclassified Olleya TaxID=2615019 RepID=UPI00119F2679|nr:MULTISPECIES: hypothetical protein [unclassified Olleya]TVZ47098.1 hypothetical protein JM82_1689 [Olleya sp. Hel_I_94]|tara:strand:- start:208730 stop:208933 length:204 start_codon:yes stop_codon:yes gene_type:complete
MMKQYKTEHDLENDLKRLSLEKQIAWEELKSIKGDFKEAVQPPNWLQTGYKMFTKFGMMMLFKKIIK